MFTRRELIVSGVSGAIPWASVVRAGAIQPSSPTCSLPAAIARLNSRRHEARPIEDREREERLGRARELMGKGGLGGIVLTGGTSLEYFAGIRWNGNERLFAMVLPAQGNPFFVCPHFEEGRAREQLGWMATSEDLDMRLWQEDESPYARLADGLRDRRIAGGRIGIEETVKFVFAQGIGAAAPNAMLVSATPVTAGCRMIKTARELELMQLANEITLAAFRAVYSCTHIGMTGEQITQLVAAAHERLGFPGEADVAIDAATASPHGMEESHTIRDGSIVMIDGGCKVYGYQSDITRTFTVGTTPPEKKKKMVAAFDIVRRAQRAALAAARPGVECEKIDAAARDVITAAGFGPDYRYFTSRLGHGIGLDMHEWPYLVRGNRMILQVGMTTSNEPGLYFPKEFGVRLEDDIVITSHGARLFTPQSGSLEMPFESST